MAGLNKYLIRRPIYILVLLNIFFFNLVQFYHGFEDFTILVTGGLLTLLMVICYYLIVKLNMGDQYIFLIMSILSSLGIVMLYRLIPPLGFQQVTWFGLGTILYFLSYIVFKWIKNWDQYTYFYLAAGILLFIITFVFGTTIKGATNWIQIGGHTFQPAEGIKILFVFFIASYFKYPEKLKNTYVFLGFVYLHIMFLVLQRDMGMVMLFYSVFISIYYIYHSDRKLLFYNIGASILIGIFSYFTMTHVQIRLETWLNPWRDIAGRGYQITQSLFAIASGGFFGTGLGLGRPDYIPEVHTDFIFSAICEELGVFGGIAVILLYFILVYRGFKITLMTRDIFDKIIALSITLIYSYQTFIIIGGVVKLIPLTGITLPFISYGGSSMVSAFVAFGILQALSKKSLEGEGVVEIEQS
ncbi:FtsW/RodA/SpoVE family cell cycle protein [Alkaliphilus peptidifermentans]|uniref:Cell division protein FtsW, lipid II flippase n=1 Tax=Alkaliphilus peptidifermentans DSM 18978 TaxID=1120976 RepID=A0A1G5L8U0_9FIRM|nr:FtsW/RodA/SpoVE family cell cycle protein [Alkaliphilus peptidifermentans]SCZ09282.1 cell division protein FtsW, lipid II flippase [Alkaliphilus peptidifermentans DSM 18978]